MIKWNIQTTYKAIRDPKGILGRTVTFYHVVDAEDTYYAMVKGRELSGLESMINNYRWEKSFVEEIPDGKSEGVSMEDLRSDFQIIDDIEHKVRILNDLGDTATAKLKEVEDWLVHIGLGIPVWEGYSSGSEYALGYAKDTEAERVVDHTWKLMLCDLKTKARIPVLTASRDFRIFAVSRIGNLLKNINIVLDEEIVKETANIERSKNGSSN